MVIYSFSYLFYYSFYYYFYRRWVFLGYGWVSLGFLGFHFLPIGLFLNPLG